MVTAVLVTPARVALGPGASFQFTAVVQGDASISQSVAWSIDEAPTGNARAGWITPDGTYRAPEVVFTTAVVVRVTSTAAPNMSGTAVVDLPSRGITITPTEVHVLAGDELQFSATLTGVLDNRIRWGSSVGAIDETGLFHAPPVALFDPVEVWAESVATGDRAAARVRVRARPSVLTDTSGPAGRGSC